MADNRDRQGQSQNRNYFSHYNDEGYRGPDDDSKGMGNDFTGGNFGSNTRSDGFWEDTRQQTGSFDATRGVYNTRQNEGPHRGKGPRGYQRSSDRIREDVCDRLGEDAHIDASDVDVRVENNEVILSGTVHSREEKRRAEDLAESISGVRNIQNQLRVDQHSNDNTRQNPNNR